MEGEREQSDLKSLDPIQVWAICRSRPLKEFCWSLNPNWTRLSSWRLSMRSTKMVRILRKALIESEWFIMFFSLLPGSGTIDFDGESESRVRSEQGSFMVSCCSRIHGDDDGMMTWSCVYSYVWRPQGKDDGMEILITKNQEKLKNIPRLSSRTIIIQTKVATFIFLYAHKHYHTRARTVYVHTFVSIVQHMLHMVPARQIKKQKHDQWIFSLKCHSSTWPRPAILVTGLRSRVHFPSSGGPRTTLTRPYSFLDEIEGMKEKKTHVVVVLHWVKYKNSSQSWVQSLSLSEWKDHCQGQQRHVYRWLRRVLQGSLRLVDSVACLRFQSVSGHTLCRRR